MATRPILAVALCLVVLEMSQAAEPEPLEFKGLKMGSSEQELKKLYPDVSCINVKDTRISDRDCVISKTTIAAVEARALFSYYSNSLASILIIFNLPKGNNSYQPARNFAPVLEALVGKYGPPTEIKTEETIMIMSVMHTDQVTYWVLPSGTITAERYSGGKIWSSVSYVSTMGVEEEKRRDAEIDKSAAERIAETAKHAAELDKAAAERASQNRPQRPVSSISTQRS